MSPDHTYVLRTVEERGVRFVRLWFVDVLGLLKSLAIPASELEAALEEGVGLDGSALEGSARMQERDVIAHPDPRTFQMLPWRPGSLVARMFCDVRMPDGTPFAGDSRSALRRVLRQAADLGFTFQVGAEIEFFLFAEPAAGELPRPLDDGAYFDLTPLDAASMADAVTTFRLAVKEVAREDGLHATFMPKPLDQHSGSGMHLHLSLFEGDRNAFYGDGPLSDLGRAFLAGVLAHAGELAAVTNQWVNSYKRLATGFEAPEQVCWTRHGRSAPARVPSNRPGKAA